MGKLKEIQLNDVFNKLAEGKRCFLIQEIDESTPIGQLLKAGGFVYMHTGPEEAPETKEVAEREEAPKDKSCKYTTNVDHGKIVSLRTAGWSVRKISEEMDISEQTVRNHLKKEDL